jgi:hypothetical protein
MVRLLPVKGKWNILDKLVIQVDGIFRSQKFVAKSSTGQVISWQVGAIRTNCLDRTNVVQSLFARRSVVFQLNMADKEDLNGAGLSTTYPLEELRGYDDYPLELGQL